MPASAAYDLCRVIVPACAHQGRHIGTVFVHTQLWRYASADAWCDCALWSVQEVIVHSMAETSYLDSTGYGSGWTPLPWLRHRTSGAVGNPRWLLEPARLGCGPVSASSRTPVQSAHQFNIVLRALASLLWQYNLPLDNLN